MNTENARQDYGNLVESRGVEAPANGGNLKPGQNSTFTTNHGGGRASGKGYSMCNYSTSTGIVNQKRGISSFAPGVYDLFFVRDDHYGEYYQYVPGKKAKAKKSNNAVSLQVIENHLQAITIIGAYSTNQDSLCRWGALDFDATSDSKKAFLNGDSTELKAEKAKLLTEVQAISNELQKNNIVHIVEDSVCGYHIWIFFNQLIHSSIAFSFLKSVLQGKNRETFPKQASIEHGKFGNWIRLPGRYHSGEWFGAVWANGQWLKTNTVEAWEHITGIERNPLEKIQTYIDKHPLAEPAQDKKTTTKAPKTDRTRITGDACTLGDGQHDEGFFRAVLETLKQSQGTFANRLDWFKFIMGCKNAGLDYDGIVDEICQQSAGYDYEKNKAKFESDKLETVTFGTIYEYAEQANPVLLKTLLAKYSSPKTPEKQSLEDEKLCKLVELSELKCMGYRLKPGQDAIDLLAEAYQEKRWKIKKLLKQRRDKALDIIQGNSPTEKQLQEESKFSRQDVIDWLKNLAPGTWGILEAGTGVGKSYMMLEAALYLISRGEKIVYFCDTKPNMNEQAGRFAKMAEMKDIDVSIGFQCHGNHSDVDTADIIFTTYGMLGRVDESTGGYAEIHKSIDGRFCFLDESQELFRQKMRTSIPLSARGSLRSRGRKIDTYMQINSCRKHSRLGNCDGCMMFFERCEAKHGSKFLPCFKKEELHKYQQFPEYPPELGTEVIFDWSQYQWAWGFTFIRTLGYGSTIPQELFGSQLDKNYCNYLKNLLGTLRNRQLRVQLPVMFVENGEPLPMTYFDEDGKLPEDTKNPQQVCMCPILFGIDIFPLLQFFKAKLTYYSKFKEKTQGDGTVTKEFSGAKAVIAASATPEPEFAKAVESVCSKKSWSIEHRKIDEIPYTFDITLLKTEKEISKNALKHLSRELGKEEIKTMLLYRNKGESQEAYSHINEANASRKVAVLFSESDYQRAGGVSARDLTEWQILCTYPRAAVTKGFDFPELQVIIVNCKSLLPTIALDGIEPGMSKEKKDRMLFDDLKKETRQIVGRAMRSIQPREPGKTVKDTVKKVVIFHDLPTWAKNLDIEKSLITNYREYSETWLSSEQDKLQESITDSLFRILDGDSPQNWKDIETGDITTHAAKNGIRTVTEKKRRMIDREKMEKLRESERLTEIEEKVIEAAKNGLEGWKAVCDRLHIYRLGKRKKLRLKKLFIKNL